jgi:hypothetical protein
MAAPPKPKVIFAVYGGLRDGNKIEGKIVTEALQKAINDKAGEKVQINNDTMGGDPAHLVPKQFAALVEVKPGKPESRRFFASEEGQTIDFTTP